MNRISSSVRNAKYGVLGQLIYFITNFVVRTFFVRYLSVEYLGLNGLFTNILSILSLAELGVGSAIIFSLYEPLAKNEIPRLKALMRVFRTAYLGIGIWMIAVGLLLSPFLGLFIKELPNIPNIKLIYMLFVANSAITYFFSYKRALIVADQKKYIDSIYQFAASSISGILQILLLVLTQNYILFLSIKFITTILENYLISLKADQYYPFLKKYGGEKLKVKDKSNIIKNIKAMLFHRIGGTVVFGTDNLLMSKFVGIVSVGIYSNYILITGALNSLINILFQSITASIGNLNVTDDKDRLQSVFMSIDFICFWIYGFSSIALINLLNPFIELWLGRQYLFQFPIVLLITVNFYIQGQRSSVLAFRDALGLFWNDRYKPLLESFINLVASYILVIRLGVIGVLIGTLISTLSTAFWIEPLILYKYGFSTSVQKYFIVYFNRLLVISASGAITWLICSVINLPLLGGLIIKMLLCAIVPNIMIALIYRKSPEFSFLIGIVKQHIRF